MITIIACFIACISTASFLILWFSIVYQEISYKKQALEDAWGQV